METVGLRNLSDFYWQTKVATIWSLTAIELNTRITARKNIELEYKLWFCAELSQPKNNPKILSIRNWHCRPICWITSSVNWMQSQWNFKLILKKIAAISIWIKGCLQTHFEIMHGEFKSEYAIMIQTQVYESRFLAVCRLFFSIFGKFPHYSDLCMDLWVTINGFWVFCYIGWIENKSIRPYQR